MMYLTFCKKLAIQLGLFFRSVAYDYVIASHIDAAEAKEYKVEAFQLKAFSTMIQTSGRYDQNNTFNENSTFQEQIYISLVVEFTLE